MNLIKSYIKLGVGAAIATIAITGIQAGTVQWANVVVPPVPSGGNPANVLGTPPNAAAWEIRGGKSAVFADFSVSRTFSDSAFKSYFNLTDQEYAAADFIIFDYNGGESGKHRRRERGIDFRGRRFFQHDHAYQFESHGDTRPHHKRCDQ